MEQTVLYLCIFKMHEGRGEKERVAVAATGKVQQVQNICALKSVRIPFKFYTGSKQTFLSCVHEGEIWLQDTDSQFWKLLEVGCFLIKVFKYSHCTGSFSLVLRENNFFCRKC